MRTIIFSEEIGKLVNALFWDIGDNYEDTSSSNYYNRHPRKEFQRICIGSLFIVVVWYSRPVEHSLRAFLNVTKFRPKFHIFLWPLTTETPPLGESPRRWNASNILWKIKCPGTVDGLNLIKCLVKLYVEHKKPEKKKRNPQKRNFILA